MGEWTQFILGTALVLLVIPLIGRALGLGFGWQWLLRGLYHAFKPARPVRRTDAEERGRNPDDQEDDEAP